MPQPAKPAPPHSLCPFMSGPVTVGNTIHLFRAACAGPVCKIFNDETGDCRFNDMDYDESDEMEGQEPEAVEVEEVEETQEAPPAQ